jgi:hypothetical protein
VSDYGATYSDVQPRVPTFAISESSEPSTTQVNAWIDEAEAKINNALKAGGITTPVANGEGVEALKALTIDYAEARVRRAAVPAGTAEAGEGVAMLEAFEAVLKDMRLDPQGWSAMLGGGSAAADTQRLRSHVTHDVDGRSRDDDAFAPTFTKEDWDSQF